MNLKLLQPEDDAAPLVVLHKARLVRADLYPVLGKEPHTPPPTFLAEPPKKMDPAAHETHEKCQFMVVG